jgi:hypothetical protein
MINTGNALQVHAPKTKIFAGRTNLSECVLEALFKGVSTVFGLRNVESASKFEHALGKVGSACENLRLGRVKLKLLYKVYQATFEIYIMHFVVACLSSFLSIILWTS